jgi:hypothetical protein
MALSPSTEAANCEATQELRNISEERITSNQREQMAAD